eukprot:g2073.t1
MTSLTSNFPGGGLGYPLGGSSWSTSSTPSRIDEKENDLPNDGVTALNFWPSPHSAADSLLLCSSWDCTVRLYNCADAFKAELKRISHAEDFSNVPTPETTVDRTSTSLNKTGLRTIFERSTPVLDSCFLTKTSIISAALDGQVGLHNVENNARTTIIGSHEKAVKSCIPSRDIGDPHTVLTGGWDKYIKLWDIRTASSSSSSSSEAISNNPSHTRNLKPVTTLELTGKIFSMSAHENRLVIGTSNRQVYIFDRRHLANGPVAERRSSLKNQTRCVEILPQLDAYAIGSTEGRIAVEYFDDGTVKTDSSKQAEKSRMSSSRKRFAFKSHRLKIANSNSKPQSEKTDTPAVTEEVYPVNVICRHPVHPTFITGGGDGLYNIWDGKKKKRLYQSMRYPTSIAALAFTSQGNFLAIASSYTWENGEKGRGNSRDEIFLKPMDKSKVCGKSDA